MKTTLRYLAAVAAVVVAQSAVALVSYAAGGVHGCTVGCLLTALALTGPALKWAQGE